jgi:hypothetical protein
LAGEAVVHHFDDGFEGSEFHHGVWDLATPERIDALVETVKKKLVSAECFRDEVMILLTQRRLQS